SKGQVGHRPRDDACLRERGVHLALQVVADAGRERHGGAGRERIVLPGIGVGDLERAAGRRREAVAAGQGKLVGPVVGGQRQRRERRGGGCCQRGNSTRDIQLVV